MEPKKKIRIGDLLVDNNIITEEQLVLALKEQRKLGLKLGQTLIELGFIGEDELLKFLASQLNIPLVNLKHFNFDADMVKRLPEAIARRFRAIVLGEENGRIRVGMADPMDIFAYDEITKYLKQSINMVIVRESELVTTFDLVYRRTEEISQLAEELGQDISESDFDLDDLLRGTQMTDAPVAKLLQTVFEDAVQVGASDIHIEPDESVLRIRQRIDGVLHEQVMSEKQIAPAVVLRLKLMASLDISEKRLPQDGRFNIRVKNHSVDVRLSTMPVQYGESVVMRLLDQTRGLISLEKLGMPESISERFRKNIQLPYGMIVVTGPTGSGKTTTLYSALREINTAEKKIITVEDPVEYRLPRINQVQVNARIGLSFASVLRSALRQDPDIIMIGEMRDDETVEIGVSAAMTGHLVLTTLHTNDTVSTAMRLMDMGAEGYLLASTLKGIIAQRLVRRICSSCITLYEPNVSETVWLEKLTGKPAETFKIKHGAGCAHCSFTGYQGRIGVYELLEIDFDMASALRDENPNAFIKAAKSSKGFIPLVSVALRHVLKGETTLEEVIRIAGEIEESERPDNVITEDADALQGADAI